MTPKHHQHAAPRREAMPSTEGGHRPSARNHHTRRHTGRTGQGWRPHGRTASGPHRSHIESGVRCPVENRRLYRALRVDGRCLAGERPEPRPVAGVRPGAPAVLRLAACP